MFRDQVRSREIDRMARQLQCEGAGFYTIQSAGHEQNVVIGELLARSDMCLLHYRSGALMLARARRFGPRGAVLDTLLGMVASRDDPIAQGRHKVWGSVELGVFPQTSTIASHVPRAVGLAFAHARALRLGITSGGRALDPSAIACCSLGDASMNHATALTGLHAARYAHRQGSPLALLVVCEDNGLGISVKTPARWIRESFGALPHLQYFEAGGDLPDIHATAREAIAHCRTHRAPVLLRLPCVRLGGHAGSDIETTYRNAAQIEADVAQDPLLANARWLLAAGIASPEALASIVREARTEVAEAATEARLRERLHDRHDVMAPLHRFAPKACHDDHEARRRRAVHRDGPAHDARSEGTSAPSRRTLGAHLNAALHEAMAWRPEVCVFGEDVARKGGVYHITAGLLAAFGPQRVFDTLLDETTVLGLALGAGQLGLLPIAEIQYLAYIHNALDQIRGEACSLPFFSAGQLQNPMVVRVAGLAYQRGFGGHFHNDNSIGALRDIPGLVIAAPSRGDDAVRMLRGALALAHAHGRVVCFLEPIALYHERDLHAPGDGGWLFDAPHESEISLPHDVGLYGEPDADVLIVSYANGLRLSLRAARALLTSHQVRARVLDVRWLAPLPLQAIEEEAARCGAVLVADECRATGGGIADAVLAHLAECGYAGRLGTVRAADSYVPLGPAASHVLISEQAIALRALALLGKKER